MQKKIWGKLAFQLQQRKQNKISRLSFVIISVPTVGIPGHTGLGIRREPRKNFASLTRSSKTGPGSPSRPEFCRRRPKPSLSDPANSSPPSGSRLPRKTDMSRRPPKDVPASQFGNTHASGKRRAHKLKKNARDTGRVSLGHPPGQTVVYRPVSQRFLVIYYRKTDRKGHFCRDTGRVSQGHPAIQGIFRKFM